MKKGVISIDGTETEIWKCFSTYMYICTSQDKLGNELFDTWTIFYFKLAEEAAEGKGLVIEDDEKQDIQTILKEIKDTSLSEHLNDIENMEWEDYNNAIQLVVNDHLNPAKGQTQI